jgi:hypothetical protein
MISFWISVVPPKIDWTRLSRQSSQSWRSAADWCSRWSRRAPSGQREPGVRPVRSGRRSPARDHLAAGQFPGPRGSPDDDAEPAAADVPAIGADVDSGVISSRHSCQRSSGCAMPATAARWGRAPASRRAAISTSAEVRTLTTTAWARAALDGHRGGPRNASVGWQPRRPRYWRATASERRECRISRLQCRA